MIDEYKEKSIEEIVDYLKNNEIGYIECDYKKVDLLLDCIKEKAKEIERLHSIIKEAREYIEELLKEEIEVTDIDNINYGEMYQRTYFSDSELGKVLQILDKVEENK